MPSYAEQLESYLTGDPAAADEVRGYCPLHEDPATSKSDSASFNFATGVWHCMGCGEGSSLRGLMAELERRADSPAAPAARSNVVPIRQPKPDPRAEELPSWSQIDSWHDRLFKNKPALDFLKQERGLTEKTLRGFRVGYDGERYTIPVTSLKGKLLNVRRYSPRARGTGKMISWRSGTGRARIFHPEFLQEHDAVVMVEGELDAMIGNQYGFPTISGTGGANTFLQEWLPAFEGKRVYLCYDCDDVGTAGANKAAKMLTGTAAAVYVVKLGLEIKGGDLTDYFVSQGHGKKDFQVLLDETVAAAGQDLSSVEAPPDSGKVVSLEESFDAGNTGPVEMVVSVVGKQSPPFLLPRTFVAKCDMNKGNVCSVCPLLQWNGERSVEIGPADPILAEMVDIPDSARDKILRKKLDLRCNDHVKYIIDRIWSVEELFVTNSIEHRTNEQQVPVQRSIFNVDSYKTRINTTVRVVGKQKPDSKTQRSMLMSWNLAQTQTTLDRFSTDQAMLKRLKRFQTKPGETPLAKCRAIAQDLSANVTHIYGRPELHIAYDLVYHSALTFEFLNQVVEKGWLEMLVMGDTRTGKSEAALNLSAHYSAGTLKSCEGMSFAGLVGGAQQIGTRWAVTWGVIPQNDRRLVILDEVSGLKDAEVIEHMSAIRSSGKAQLTKIAAEETSARTRLIWISNPPDGRRLYETPGSAMSAISKLVPNPEDVARFDFAMAAAGSDVPIEDINSANPPRRRHRYTAQACSELVLWVWSRTADQVLWDTGAEDAVIAAALAMGRRYVSDPPLVQAENVRTKIARIAVALAGRTFSTEDGENLLVRTTHVHDAVEFLDWVYGNEAMGYARHSRRSIAARDKAEEEKSNVRKFLSEHREDILHTLLSVGQETFKNRDFVEFGNMDAFEAQATVRSLLEWKMIRRMSKGSIRMEPTLIELLKEFEDAEEAT